MGATTTPKKGETLEVRLPHAVKTAFMAHCREEGRTASETVRRLIEGEMVPPPPAAASFPRLRWWQVVAAAMAGLAVGGAAAPSLAHPSAAHPSSACRPAAAAERPPG